MRYVTSIERLAKQEGVLEGREEGIRDLRELLLDVLQIRFGNLSEDMVSQLQEIDNPDTLKELHRRAVTAESVSSFIEYLHSV